MPEPVSIQVGGNVDGSIVVGDHNFVVNTNHGTIVYKQAGPQVKLRQFAPQPPRLPRGFVNRSAELLKLESLIAANEIVVLHAPDGIGKTALLKQAANLPAAKAMPNGVILLENVDVNGQTFGPDDIIQRLFDALFESDPPLKVDAVSARTYLSNTRPLVLFDEVSLSPVLQKTLPDLFPNGSILVTADAPFGANFQRLPIGPLPRAEAINLLVTGANMTLSDYNRASLNELCLLLNDVSLAIVITSNVLRETGASPDEALENIRKISSAEHDPITIGIHRAFSFAFNKLSPQARNVISAAALTPGVSMSPEWLSTVLGGGDVQSVIEPLKALGLLFANSPRLRLPPGLRAVAKSATVLDEETILTRLIPFLLAPLQNNPQDWEHIQNELGNFFGALIWAASNQRWGDVIRLGRALDPYLSLHGLWDAWNLALSYMLDAARETGDQSLRAWALHQSGTRAIGVGGREQALDLLKQALELRRRLGDTVGAAYTQHNLDLFIGMPPNRQSDVTNPQLPKPKPKPAGGGGGKLFLLLGGMGAMGILAALVIVALWFFWPTPDVTPTQDIPPDTVTITPIPPDTWTPLPPGMSTLTPSPEPSFTSTPMPELNIRLVNANAKKSEMPILYQGDDDQDYFEIPVIVNVGNPDQINIDEANVSIALNDTDFAEFRLDGENTFQRIRNLSIDSPIKLNLKISKKYQAASVTLKTVLDICQQNIQCPINAPLKIKIPGIVYDFLQHAGEGTWTGYDPTTETSYDLPFNGPRTDQQGSVQLASDEELEDGTAPDIVLFTHPTWVSNINKGFIFGRYDFVKEASLQPGDLLVTRVGFIKVAGGIDGVTFHLGYTNSNVRSSSFLKDLFQIKDDGADGKLKGTTLLLPDDIIAGNFSTFYLKVDAGDTTNSDWAVWVSTYIARP